MTPGVAEQHSFPVVPEIKVNRKSNFCEYKQKLGDKKDIAWWWLTTKLLTISRLLKSFSFWYDRGLIKGQIGGSFKHNKKKKLRRKKSY